MAYKSSPPPSWLAVLQSAKTVFIGEARVTQDVRVSAAETSFRGAGWRITVQISPQQTLLGSLPDPTLELQGDTQRAPEARLGPTSGLFPPDTLRQLNYWDYARANTPQRVLVVISDPTIVRILTGPEDDLPQAVIQILAWLKAPGKDQKAAVLENLSKSVYNPVAYLAGFELLLTQKADSPALFEAFNRLPGRPAAAIQGIIDRISGFSNGMSDSELKALAMSLLEQWKTENDPAVLASYLLWFGAYGPRIWGKDPDLRKTVLAEAQRAQAMTFSGANADQWQQRVRYYASTLAKTP
jgi:hypothetical protein